MKICKKLPYLTWVCFTLIDINLTVLSFVHWWTLTLHGIAQLE